MRAAVRQLSCATPERSAEMLHYLDFGARLSARSRMPRFPDQDWRGSHMSAFQPFIACDRHLARNRSSQADFHGKSSLLSPTIRNCLAADRGLVRERLILLGNRGFLKR